MTSQGSAHGRLRRAVARRDLHAVRIAAAEVGVVPLDDALDILILVRDLEPARYARAAARFHARLMTELEGLLLADADRLCFALDALGVGDPVPLRHVVRRLGWAAGGRVLDRPSG